MLQFEDTVDDKSGALSSSFFHVDGRSRNRKKDGKSYYACKESNQSRNSENTIHQKLIKVLLIFQQKNGFYTINTAIKVKTVQQCPFCYQYLSLIPNKTIRNVRAIIPLANINNTQCLAWNYLRYQKAGIYYEGLLVNVTVVVNT